MSDEASVIQIHSVAEAYLYLMVQPCPFCENAPLEKTHDLTKTGPGDSGWRLSASCPACRQDSTLLFEIQPPPTREQAQSSRINPTPRPSRAIDLLGWLTLFQSILAAANKQKGAQRSRELAAEAAQCLDEALKFYQGDEELPPPDAFFTERSRRRFEAHPQQFARSQWLERRLRLPDTNAQTTAAASSRKPKWWQFWRRRDAD